MAYQAENCGHHKAAWGMHVMGCGYAYDTGRCIAEQDGLGHFTGRYTREYVFVFGEADANGRCKNILPLGGEATCEDACFTPDFTDEIQGIFAGVPVCNRKTVNVVNGNICCQNFTGDVLPQPCSDDPCGACCATRFITGPSGEQLIAEGCADVTAYICNLQDVTDDILGNDHPLNRFQSNQHCFLFQDTNFDGFLEKIPNERVECTRGSCCTLFGDCRTGLSEAECVQFGGRFRPGQSCDTPCTCPPPVCTTSNWSIVFQADGYAALETTHGIEIDDGGGCQTGHAEFVLDDDGYLVSEFCGERGFGIDRGSSSITWPLNPVIGGRDVPDGYLTFEGIQAVACNEVL